MYLFGLAVVLRFLHTGLSHILPLRGEPYDDRGVYHGVVKGGEQVSLRPNWVTMGAAWFPGSATLHALRQRTL